MNITKLLIGSLIAGVLYFFSGWASFGIILAEPTALPDEIRAVFEYPEEEFKISYMIASCLLAGLLITLVVMWAKKFTFGSGFIVAGILGLLHNVSSGLSISAMYKFQTVPQIAMNGVADLLCFGLAGGVVAWYLGRNKETA